MLREAAQALGLATQGGMSPSEANRIMVACEKAADDLEAMIEAAAKRAPAAAVTEDDRRRVFMAGFGYGLNRQVYLEKVAREEEWPDGVPIPANSEEAWAIAAALIAKGQLRG